MRRGGHDIPRDVILRRYSRGIDNLFKLFLQEVDTWFIYDNSEYKRERIAFGGRSIPTVVDDVDRLTTIKSYVR